MSKKDGRPKFIHCLKIWPEPFRAVREGRKRFEYRNNDRDFRVGDHVFLFEWNPEGERYTGREILVEVTYVLTGDVFGVPPDFAVLSIEIIPDRDEAAP